MSAVIILPVVFAGPASAASATLTLSVTPSVALGDSISGTATVTGAAVGAAPTGTVRFKLFRPGDTTCTGRTYAENTVGLSGGPPSATANSGNVVPVTAGIYRWVASYSGDANYASATTACNNPHTSSVVNQAQPVLVAAPPTPTVALGNPVSESAKVFGVGGQAPPTGNVTFKLFGPNNVTCVGAPANSVTWPLASGTPPFSVSGPLYPAAVGAYRWIVAYSGDANYTAATTACNDPNQTSVVTQATPAFATSATHLLALGAPISDTATVTGPPTAATPTGWVTFKAYYPGDDNCAGPTAFHSFVPLSGGPPTASANSGAFTPIAPGNYRWTAEYTGDANYFDATGACNDANETSFVLVPVTITMTATGTATLGSPISATATLTSPPGLAAPTGKVTFFLYANTTCTGVPVFIQQDRPLSRTGSPRATSGPVTPTSAGAYHWIADYSGDANHLETLSACNAPNSTSVVGLPTAVIMTSTVPNARLGNPISASAVLYFRSGRPAPTGTVTFRVFHGIDTTCAGTPAFDSGPRPLSGGTQPTAISGAFTPTSSDTYRWTVKYSGDANYAPTSTACGGAGQISIITR